jgi:hypothetical protein
LERCAFIDFRKRRRTSRRPEIDLGFDQAPPEPGPLRTQFRDSSLRLVYQVGRTRIEKAAGKEAVIFTSTTPDGFEISFEYSRRQIAELLEAFVGADFTLSSHAEVARLLA